MDLCGESVKSCDDVIKALRNADDVEHARSGVVSAIHVYGDRIAGLLACALVCLTRDESECDEHLCGGTVPWKSKYMELVGHLTKLADKVPVDVEREGWESVVTHAIGCLLQQEQWIESEVRRELEQLRKLRELWSDHGQRCLEAAGVGCGSPLSIIMDLVKENKRREGGSPDGFGGDWETKYRKVLSLLEEVAWCVPETVTEKEPYNWDAVVRYAVQTINVAECHGVEKIGGQEVAGAKAQKEREVIGCGTVIPPGSRTMFMDYRYGDDRQMCPDCLSQQHVAQNYDGKWVCRRNKKD